MDLWQEIGDHFDPNHAVFTRTQRTGENRFSHIYDSTPVLMARSLSTTLDGLLKPKTSRWMDLTVDDEELAEDEAVKFWLDDTVERLWSAMYRDKAGFIKATAETDRNVVTYGLGAVFIGTNEDDDGLQFISFHPKDFAIGENSRGRVDTFAVVTRYTPRQMIHRYSGSDDSIHPDVMKEFASKDGHKKEFPVVHMVLPRDDPAAGAVGAKAMPWASIHLDVENEHIIRESGYEEFRLAIPRWETSPGEIYARSPAMSALADAKTLQQMAKTILRGGQLAVDPPIWAVNDAVTSPVRIRAGGLTIIDAESMRNIGREPLGALELGKNLPIGREMMMDVRESIGKAFYRDVFALPIEGRQMTATEILERKEEFIRTIGPTFGRLESDYIGPLAMVSFEIMRRAGAFLPVPDALLEDGVTLKFDFMSPVQKARKQAEALNFANSFQILGPLAQAGQPEIMDNIDGEKIARDLPEWAGISPKWIRPTEEVEKRRGARQEQEEISRVVEAAPQVSGAIKDLAESGATGPITGTS